MQAAGGGHAGNGNAGGEMAQPLPEEDPFPYPEKNRVEAPAFWNQSVPAKPENVPCRRERRPESRILSDCVHGGDYVPGKEASCTGFHLSKS